MYSSVSWCPVCDVQRSVVMFQDDVFEVDGWLVVYNWYFCDFCGCVFGKCIDDWIFNEHLSFKHYWYE